MTVSVAPDGRRAQAIWLHRQELALASATAAALRKVVGDAVDRYIGTLTAAGDPGALDSIPTAWNAAVAADLVPRLEELHAAGQLNAWNQLPADPPVAFARQWERLVNENVFTYRAEVTNRLAGVGEATWQMVRAKVTSAISSGLSTENLKTQLESVTRFSEFRADTVARTETNAAYRRGDRAGQIALGPFGPVERTWRSTDDARTREDHADADGQTIGMTDRYDVGGESMDAPMDPTASAGNVVNCRCYEEYLYPGDVRPDGSTIPENATSGPPGPITFDDDAGDDDVDEG